MRVLITGATGFLGLNLAELLVDNGYEVIGISRGLRNLGLERLKKLGVNHVKLDLTKEKPELKGVDAVIHLASPHPFKGASKGRRAHLLIARNLVEAMRKQSIDRIIFTSVASVTCREGIVDESTEPTPCIEHAMYKLEVERLLLNEMNRGLYPTILRPTVMYGPWQIGDGLHLLFRAISRGALWTRLKIRDLGYIQPVYVKDVCLAILNALKNDKTIGKTYFIAEDKAYSFEEFQTIIYNALGKSPPRTSVSRSIANLFIPFSRILDPFNPFLQKDLLKMLSHKTTYSIKSAKKDLSFKPLPLEKGIKMTLSWYISFNPNLL